ncbi:unnamed protein product [Mortierella alpina]
MVSSSVPMILAIRRAVRKFKGSYPDPPKTVLMDMPQLARYTEAQGTIPVKHVDFDFHPTCFAGLPSEGNELETAKSNVQRFVRSLARTLIHLAIHVFQARPQEEEHEQQQRLAVLAGLAMIFELTKLETLRLVGLPFILENAPSKVSLPLLTILVLDGVSIESENSANILKELIQSCRLETLVVTHANQTSDRLAHIIDDCVRAKHLRNLKVLDISNNNLSRVSMTTVVERVLSCCSKLDQLYLQGNMGPDMNAIPPSHLTHIEMSHVGFVSVERLVQAASLQGPLSSLVSIIVRHVTLEGPMGRANFDSLCAALREGGALRRLIVVPVPDTSFWHLAHHDLGIDFTRMGPLEYFWNEAALWVKTLGECLDKDATSCSLTQLYLAGVTDFDHFHPDNPIAMRIREYAPRLQELAPIGEELAQWRTYEPLP